MNGFSIQFRGVENAALLVGLAAAIAASLAGYGLWQWLAGHRRRGAGALTGGLVAGGCVALMAFRVPLAGAAQRGLWMVVLAGLIVLAVGVFYSVVYAYLGRRRIMMLLALRFLAILALLLVLFKPALSLQPSESSRKLALPIMVDRSGSMDAIDAPELPSRYRQAVEALSVQRDRLAKNFRVGWRHFASKVQSTDDLEDLASLSASGPDTDSTDIALALRQAAAGYAPDEMAGVILISDGLHNAAGNVLDAARESPVPIYVIGVGSEQESAVGQRNVRLLDVDAPLEAVQNNVTTLTARIRLTGWANIPTKVTLSEGDRQVDTQQVLTESNAQTTTVRLKWTPGEPPAGAAGADIRRLRLAVEPNPAESTADDNAADLHLLVTQPNIRVLYVEGTLRPEYKYLRRILSADPNIRCASLVRLAENRFLSQGSIDDKQLTGLPAGEAEVRAFDVIILGDIDRAYLRADLMEQIRKFVNDGKALLMLGGRTSFGPGGYGDTPIEAALPVIVGGRGQAQETTPFVPQLTAAGATSPIFAGLEKFFATPGAKPAQPVPELLGCVTVAAAKPGAGVLAVHPAKGNAAGPLVVLAVQQYGAGRSAAFTADTTWQWYLKLQPLGVDNPYHRFWGQLIRWLAGVEKKDRAPASSVLARLDKAYLQSGEDLKITAQVKDAAGVPASEAAVTATLKDDPRQKGEEVALAASQAPGVYEGVFRPLRSGKYAVAVSANDRQGKALGKDELPAIVAPHSKEAERLARDSALLRAIAAQRNGRYAELSALPDVADEIIQRQKAHSAPAPPPRNYDLYDFTLLFVLFVGLLTAEWVLRRSWQLQ